MSTAIIGAGVMGETLLSGLVRAGRRVDQLMVGEKRAERARELEERYGVAVVSNPPALVDEGMAAISPGSHCDESHLAEAESLMASTGKVLRIPEKQMD